MLVKAAGGPDKVERAFVLVNFKTGTGNIRTILSS